MRNPDLSFLQQRRRTRCAEGTSHCVLAGEDIKRIADDCGTSTAMIHRHYLHDLDMHHELQEDFSFDGAVCEARRGLRSPRGSVTDAA